MRKTFPLILMFSTLISSAWSTPEIAISMVPRGKLLESVGRDHIVKTHTGTKIDIEFKRSGELEKAKGSNLNKGDELEPGDGLISLSSAAQSLSKTGIKPQGHWVLELDPKLGWIYEFSNKLINARTGQVIN